MEYAHGFAVVAILFLVTGFGVGTASVPVAQLCFVLAAVTASIGIVLAANAMKSRPRNMKMRGW